MSRNYTITFVLGVVLIDSMSVSMVIPVLPKIIGELTGLSSSRAATVAGYLLASFAFMQFVVSPVLGSLSDRYGRRPIILWSLVGLSIDYFVMFWAVNVQMLFIARVVSGGLAATIPAASSCIVDISEPGERAKLFGLVGVSIGLGYFLGPVMGGLIGELNHRLPFAISGAICVITAIWGWIVLPESLAADKRRPVDLARANPMGALVSVTRYPRMFPIIVSVFLIQMAAHSIGSTWPFFAAEVFHWGSGEVGLSLGLFGLMIVIVQGMLTQPFVTALGEERTVVCGLLFGIASYLSIALVTEPKAVWGLIILVGFSQLIFPAIQSITTMKVPPNSQGELQGALASSYSLTMIIGPIVMTQLFWSMTENTGFYFPGVPFALSAVLMMAALALFLVAVLKRER